MTEPSYKLDELARAAGTSPRTVRYYVQRGLLPPPAFRGKDSAYGRAHLVRLRAIRKLQAAHLPLDEIAATLEGKSMEALERLADAAVAEEPPAVERPRSVPEAVAVRRFRRVTVADGLELHVADDAGVASKALAEKILNLISKLEEGA